MQADITNKHYKAKLNKANKTTIKELNLPHMRCKGLQLQWKYNLVIYANFITWFKEFHDKLESMGFGQKNFIYHVKQKNLLM